MWLNAMQIMVRAKDLYYKIISRKQIEPEKEVFGNNENRTTDVFLKEKNIACIKRIIGSLFELPDKMIGWLVPAVWAGYWLIKREDIDIIFSTAPPPTVSLVGLVLSKLTGKKLVTDLRDPFYLHDGKPLEVRSKLSDAIERWLEKSIIENSHKIITTTEKYTKYLKNSHCKRADGAFFTIWNGYDSNDFGGIKKIDKPNKKFSINYLGSFYLSRTPKEFLIALGDLVKDGLIPIKEINVKFIGNVEYADGVLTRELVIANQLEDCVEIKSKIPYKESLIQLMNSDVLLLFAPEYMYYAVPAKTFEYLYTNNYILCLTTEGATSDLLKRYKNCYVVDSHNIEAIKKSIYELYLFWKENKKPDINSDIGIFERKEQIKILSSILDTE